MLSNHPVHPAIPASNLDRACTFYRETLGIPELRRFAGGVQFGAAGGTQFLVYPTPNAGQSPATVMGFRVDDLDKEVEDLRSRGVQLEEYDLPGLKTVNGIAETGGVRAAWFTDSEGNILGLAQYPPDN